MHYHRHKRTGSFELAPRPSVEERFWAKVASGEPDQCWEWQGTRHPPRSKHVSGYGAFYERRGGQQYSHRMAWKLTYGPIPEGAFVLHYCDNPPCCNPAHLHLGDHTLNMREMVERGRSCSDDRNGSRTHPESLRLGEAHQNSKLTENEVRVIRLAGELRIATNETIADWFNVSPGTIEAILARKRWQHVQ